MMSSQGHQQPPGVSGTVRPMTEPERESLKSASKPQRNNAIGISMLAMVMAVMVNFVDDPIALLMPLVFSFIGLGLAAQARRGSGTAAQAVAKGTVTDVRGTPRWKGGATGWDFGPFSVVKNSQLEGVLADGVPATVGVIPESRRVVSANGVPLKRPVELRAGPGFESVSASSAAPQPPYQAPAPADQDLPPPPEGWSAGSCPQCGTVARGGAMFCERCGHRLGP